MLDGAGPSADQASTRGAWGSRLGFVLAAAGSAVGLGNVWKFPYVTGNNGGGLFVVLYLACVLGIGLPIMIAEILAGRATQRSPVGAFRTLAPKTPWVAVGWLGAVAGMIILSYYSVVAGWVLHYLRLAVGQGFSGIAAETINQMFGDLVANSSLNVVYHGIFMLATMGVVVAGVKSGIERWARLLMPALLVMMIGLMIYAATLSGFGTAASFVFGAHTDQLKPAGVLAAMGQAFFSLSLGMGAMLTYGSYLTPGTNILRASLWVVLLDTGIALMASLVIFPITFTHGIEASAGPGLVFQSVPLAFSQMAAGRVLSIVFFALLAFAALTSTISLLEVVASTMMDVLAISRRRATMLTGAAIFLLGVPSAMSFGDGLLSKAWRTQSFFDVMEHVSSNWMLPLGGLLLAIYIGFFMNSAMRRAEYVRGAPGNSGVGVWLAAIRYVAPVAVALVMAESIGLLGLFSRKS